jgi:hypothetical protein
MTKMIETILILGMTLQFRFGKKILKPLVEKKIGIFNYGMVQRYFNTIIEETV